MPEYGVHSEVGQLRKMIVHRPGLWWLTPRC
jgi:arginine deiminase